jgi:hypothetical protein
MTSSRAYRLRVVAATRLDWYSHDLRPKIARAAKEGRVAAVRAVELHRLMTDLIEADPRPQGDVQRIVSMKRQAPW